MAEMYPSSYRIKVASKLTQLEKAMLFLLWSDFCSPVRGRTTLQSEMFLVAIAIPDIGGSSDFMPHARGAYSEAVEAAMDKLESYGLAVKRDDCLYITDTGKEVVSLFEKDLDEEEKEAITRAKASVNKMTAEESLVYNYFLFPGYTTDSASIDAAKRDRIPASVSLYKRGLINLEKAVHISGLPEKEFLKRV